MVNKKVFILSLLLCAGLLTGCSSIKNYNDEVPGSTVSSETSSTNSTKDTAAEKYASGISKADIDSLSPDLKKIFERGKIIVGVYGQDRPPFFMEDKAGNLYGFDISLAKDIADYLGVAIEFNRKAATFNDLTDMLVKEEVDMVVSKFSRTFERSRLVRFSKPYINLRKALLVNRIQAVKLGIEDYPIDYMKKNKFKIGVVEGTSFVEYAKDLFPSADILQYKNWEDAVTDLTDGKITAALYDDNEVNRLVRQKPDIALYASVYDLKDQKDSISIAVPWQSTQLLAWINDFLDTFDIEKNVDDLIKEYPDVYKEQKETR